MEGENKMTEQQQRIKREQENKRTEQQQGIYRGYLLFGVNTKYISLSAVKKSVFFTSAQHE